MAMNSAVRTLPGAAQEYQEPETFDALRDKCAAACTTAAKATTLDEAMLSVAALSSVTLETMKRFQACYAALMHFAKHGSHMANMKMCLVQNGRQGEPAGGVWLNGLQSANVQPNEHLFYAAIDAVGRKALEDAMVADFERIQAAAKLTKERDEHVAAANLEGPIGGPVSGKVQ